MLRLRPYKSCDAERIGKDIQTDEYEFYHILGEKWKCLELEMERGNYPA